MAKITIFGMAGTGKTSTGKAVAAILDYKFFSAGDFARETAKNLGVSINELDELSKYDSKYDLERDRVQEEFGKTHNDFVVEARLAWHFIPDSFKICLQCNFDERTKRIAFREAKDVEVVRQETIQREKAIYERFEKYYGLVNFEDEKHFDLLIDTEKNDFQAVIRIIIDELKLREIVK